MLHKIIGCAATVRVQFPPYKSLMSVLALILASGVLSFMTAPACVVAACHLSVAMLT